VRCGEFAGFLDAVPILPMSQGRDMGHPLLAGWGVRRVGARRLVAGGAFRAGLAWGTPSWGKVRKVRIDKELSPDLGFKGKDYELTALSFLAVSF